MPRPFTPKVITANDLIEGDVIYMSQDGSWVRDICLAWLIHDEAQAATQLARAHTQPDIAVGPYLADAAQGPTGPAPKHFREAFRAKGPSNRFHGKQTQHSEPEAAANV